MAIVFDRTTTKFIMQAYDLRAVAKTTLLDEVCNMPEVIAHFGHLSGTTKHSVQGFELAINKLIYDRTFYKIHFQYAGQKWNTIYVENQQEFVKRLERTYPEAIIASVQLT